MDMLIVIAVLSVSTLLMAPLVANVAIRLVGYVNYVMGRLAQIMRVGGWRPAALFAVGLALLLSLIWWRGARMHP